MELDISSIAKTITRYGYAVEMRFKFKGDAAPYEIRFFAEELDAALKDKSNTIAKVHDWNIERGFLVLPIVDVNDEGLKDRAAALKELVDTAVSRANGEIEKFNAAIDPVVDAYKEIFGYLLISNKTGYNIQNALDIIVQRLNQ